MPLLREGYSCVLTPQEVSSRVGPVIHGDSPVHGNHQSGRSGGRLYGLRPVTGTSQDEVGAAAAAPSDDIRGGGTATDTGLLSVCPECSRAFGSVKSLSQHWRRAHPTEYHAENVPAACFKAR